MVNLVWRKMATIAGVNILVYFPPTNLWVHIILSAHAYPLACPVVLHQFNPPMCSYPGPASVINIEEKKVQAYPWGYPNFHMLLESCLLTKPSPNLHKNIVTTHLLGLLTKKNYPTVAIRHHACTKSWAQLTHIFLFSQFILPKITRVTSGSHLWPQGHTCDPRITRVTPG